MSAAPASETLRSLGLLVDGPAIWGRPLPSRAPGVFVVELPGGAPEAPIDLAAVRRWLERVPALLLDGRRPTPHQLARRLADFWLPAEPILYVGRSAKSLAARVAALHATQLGDSRPHAGGHWLKTLAVLTELRLWWAETDAHEEYEDALLAEVAGRQPPEVVAGLPAESIVLPFANLQSATGEVRRHGLSNSLREHGPTAAPTARPSDTPTRARARRPREEKTVPPPPAPTYLSQGGVDDLAIELEHLRSQVRPGVIARVKAARELGDLRENADYEAARREQSFVEGRIQALEALIRSAVVVKAPVGGGSIAVGSTVVVDVDGTEQTWVIVGSMEADPAAGRISYASPVGQALVGRRAGDEAVAKLPRGELRMRIVEVR